MRVRKTHNLRNRLMKMHGTGFFGDLWSGLKKGVSYGYDFLRKYKPISTALTAASLVPGVNAFVAPSALLSSALGFGKRKVHRKKTIGGKTNGGRRKKRVAKKIMYF